MITNHERSLVANLAAAEAFDKALVGDAVAQKMLAAVKVIYVTSFFLTHSPEAALALGRYAADKNKVFVMNISAPFLVQVPVFKERVCELLCPNSLLFLMTMTCP